MNINISLWAGLIFCGAGIITAIAGELLPAIALLALGVSVLLIEPQMTTGKQRDTIDEAEETEDRPDDKGELWGLKLTSRNVVAFVLLAVSVLTFLMVTWGDFSD